MNTEQEHASAEEAVSPSLSPEIKDMQQSEPPPPPDLPPLPESIRIEDLQELTHEELTLKLDELRIRYSMDRTRHQLILDLCRFYLSRGVRIEGAGVLEIPSGAHGYLRWPIYNFKPCPEDVYVPVATIRNFDLRPGHQVLATLTPGRDKDKFMAVGEVISVDGRSPAEIAGLPHFDSLTAAFPRRRIVLDNPKSRSVSPRAVDLLAPIGCGTRGLIIAPPRVGKTILLKEIAMAIRASAPDIRVILLLVDERPEEVTDLKRSVDAEIFSSTFDENATRHTQVAELVNQRAKRLVELGQDVVILIDSITRLSRGYNNLQPGKGRIMSGGVDAKALMKPKKFFGSARNVEEGGSLTILATALVDTGSRADEVIFEEFKGTGNMEIQLDRGLSERRVFPAIHPLNSATRRDDLLYHPQEYEKVQLIRKQLAALPPIEAMELLIRNLKRTESNAELLMSGLK